MVMFASLLAGYGLLQWTQIVAIARFADDICVFSPSFFLRPGFAKIGRKVLA